MKKTNNKYRNNNSNQIYSLNYKFDSISIAGKISGTALDLIKKYNELAKEAHANGDFVTSEVFKQYAEHYRKIVTEINEKKNAQKVVNFPKNADVAENADSANENAATDIDLDIAAKADEEVALHNVVAAELDAPIEDKTAEKKELKIVEILEADVQDNNAENAQPKKARRCLRKKAETANADIKNEDIAV